MTDTSRSERDTTPFALETRQRANEILTELDAKRTSIEGQIEQLRVQLESVGRESAEAQVVLDALDGKLVRPNDTSRLEPATAAPVRAEWGDDIPAYIDPAIMARAREFVTSREGSFTLTDLATAVRGEFPDDVIEGHTADAILTELLNADAIMVDHEASTATMPRYVAVTPADPGVTHTSPPTEELESARSEEGGVKPKSEEESGEPAEVEPSEDSAPAKAASDEDEVPVTPEEIEEDRQAQEEREPDEQPDDETVAVLPLTSGTDRQKVIDDAVLEHLSAHPRCRREDIMSALSLTDIAAAQSLSRLVKAHEAKIVGTDPTRWSLANAEPPKPSKPEPDTATTNGATTAERQSPTNQYLSTEIVRDHAIMYERERGTPWNKREFAEYMSGKLGREVKPASIQDYVKDLGDSGVFKRTGGARGPGVKYQYVKPNGGGPASRPRHDHPRQAPKGVQVPERGEAVAHTGRAKGRADTSGKNKKAQSLGFRVRTSRGDRKRAG